MRVEQRIGRIDRLGQKFPDIQIVNLHYADTVETDVYLALRQRIGLFETVVGRLQPILARLPSLISSRVLRGQGAEEEDRQAAVAEIDAEAERAEGGFDLDAVTEADLEEPPRPEPPLTMVDLDRVVASAVLLPPGMEVSPLGQREYAFRQPGLSQSIRVSTDPAYYEQHAETMELWSPGNPAFPGPDHATTEDDPVAPNLTALIDALAQKSSMM
jgi:hypothetical protein